MVVSTTFFQKNEGNRLTFPLVHAILDKDKKKKRCRGVVPVHPAYRKLLADEKQRMENWELTLEWLPEILKRKVDADGARPL